MQSIDTAGTAGRWIKLSRDRRAALALTGAALLWSGNFIAGRALRGDIDPLALNLLHWTLCLLLFLPWVGPRVWQARRTLWREWRLLALLGATGIAAFHTLVYQALRSTTAIQALLMLSLTPAAILLGACIIGRQAPNRTQWAGSLLSLAGAVVLVTRGQHERLQELAFTPGDLWMLAAVLLWTVYSLALRRRPADLPPDVALAGSIVAALLLLAPAALLSGPTPPIRWSAAVWTALAYVALFASLVAFLLWSYGVAAIGPERAGHFVHLMPLFGAVLATSLLGETLVPAQLGGAVCVLTGIMLVQRQARASAARL